MLPNGHTLALFSSHLLDIITLTTVLFVLACVDARMRVCVLIVCFHLNPGRALQEQAPGLVARVVPRRPHPQPQFEWVEGRGRYGNALD